VVSDGFAVVRNAEQVTALFVNKVQAGAAAAANTGKSLACGFFWFADCFGRRESAGMIVQSDNETCDVMRLPFVVTGPAVSAGLFLGASSLADNCEPAGAVARGLLRPRHSESVPAEGVNS